MCLLNIETINYIWLSETVLKLTHSPKNGKKQNIIIVYKRGNKQLITNYRPVSLFPIYGKVFEKIIFNSLFVVWNNNNQLNSNLSGFRPGDSCVHQLISITHDIYKAFHANPSLEVRRFFLDFSKTFDKVWHDGLLYKTHGNMW